MSHPEPVTIDLEVRYAETDQMGIVHHANYVTWFEVARTHLCAQSGWHYAEIEDLGYLLMVVGVDVTYRNPARYGETVSVRCWVEKLLSRGVHFGYEVHGEEGLLATGTTRHVWVAKNTRRPCRTPKELLRPFEELAGAKSG